MPKNRQALVAIIGEPNVGKSTLMNRLVSGRPALVSNIAGTTRDRFYADTSWNGLDFTLIDTAGIILDFASEDGSARKASRQSRKNTSAVSAQSAKELEANVQKQVQIALEQCDLILYMLDGKKNPESVNRNILAQIRRKKKPVILLVNKTDSPKKISENEAAYAFTGIKKIFAISATSGVNIGDMLDAVVENLHEQGFATVERDPSELSIGIIGKPNVGKSSLFNAIIGEERVVVSNVPGTTRNSVDTQIEYKGKKITLVDTAGLKRKEKKAPLPDIYAAFQTVRTLHNSDICIFVIDGVEGISQQDQHIAGEIVKASKGLVIAVNKTDLLSDKERNELQNNLGHFFPFLWWAPVTAISAQKKKGINELLKLILQIEENRHKEIDNQRLAEFFSTKTKMRQPQRIRDERVPKVFSLRQVHVNPPVFEMTVNRPSAISMQFRKFIQNAIIKELGFWGTPVKLSLVEKAGNPNQKSVN